MNGYGLFAAAFPPASLFLQAETGTGRESPGKSALSLLIAAFVVLWVILNRRKRNDSSSLPKKRDAGPSPFAGKRETPRPADGMPAGTAPAAGGAAERREELRSLLEAGLITREEYRERLAAIDNFRR